MIVEELSYCTVDKSEWDEGPWQLEPDKLQFTDSATGMPCLIVRNHAGALCGYVAVSEEHAAFGLDYSNDLLNSITVHGGLTFAGPCGKDSDLSRGICHSPDQGESDHVWWFGFDCAHPGDVCPGIDATLRKIGRARNLSLFATDEYRDVAYVKNECAELAAQLFALRAPMLEHDDD